MILLNKHLYVGSMIKASNVFQLVIFKNPFHEAIKSC